MKDNARLLKQKINETLNLKDIKGINEIREQMDQMIQNEGGVNEQQKVRDTIQTSNGISEVKD